MSHLVITGASAGIGRAAALDLAPRFSHVTLIGRNPARHQTALDRLGSQHIDATLVECDLRSLQAVGEAAAEVRDGRPIDVFVANAGVAGARGSTADGFEIHFGVNHLAHHLLVTELADRIVDRVVVVSSNTHYDSTSIPWDRLRGPTTSLTGFREYRDSKLANVLFGRELARRFAFAVHIVHPGVVATDIWRRIPWPIRPLLTRRMASPAEGARTVTWAATAEDLESGGYYTSRSRHEPSEMARDDAAAITLWEQSEEWVEPFRRSAA